MPQRSSDPLLAFAHMLLYWLWSRRSHFCPGDAVQVEFHSRLYFTFQFLSGVPEEGHGRNFCELGGQRTEKT